MDTERRRNFRPGWDVHWIQSSHAFRDRDGMESVRLIAVRGDEFHLLRADGRVTRHQSFRTAEVERFLATGDDLPALFSERWRVLAVIVGEGSREARGVTALGACRLEDGAAVEMLTREPGLRMILFSVATLPDDPGSGPDT